MKLCDAPLAQIAKTRQAVLNQCPNDLFVNTCRLNISAKNPVNTIPRMFNALPVDVKMIECDKAFICKIRELALTHQFYDFDDFSFVISVQNM